jgi:hypothetical protein
MWEKTFTSRSRTSALALCLAVAGSPALGAGHTFDGDYSGKRVLTKGSPGPTCPAEENVSVAIHGETVSFTDSVLTNFLQPFYPSQDGSFGENLTTEGGATVSYHGRIVGDIMDLDLNNPPCEYHWHLKKQ